MADNGRLVAGRAGSDGGLSFTNVNPDGVWGLCGRDAEIIHFCQDGKALCRKHPLLKFPLKNWKPTNPHTCPVCKKYYNALLAERAGITETEENAALS